MSKNMNEQPQAEPTDKDTSSEATEEIDPTVKQTAEALLFFARNFARKYAEANNRLQLPHHPGTSSQLPSPATSDRSSTSAAGLPLRTDLPTNLTSYEIEEIRDFSCIYFSGAPRLKKYTHFGKDPNHQFDTPGGFYKYLSGDHILYRYEVLEALGKGSFSQVLEAYDHKEGRRVALKILRKTKKMENQVKREIHILKKLANNDPHDEIDIVRMHGDGFFRGHAVIVFELLSFNLYKLLKRSDFRGLPIRIVRQMAYRILEVLRFLHSNEVVHGDLKPENVSLKLDGRGLKVIDFGASTSTTTSHYTYIQSRFYRAPEVILELEHGPPIDMWSFGCLLAELLTGQPLLPGVTEYDQLALMMELRGLLPYYMLEDSKKREKFMRKKNSPLYCTLVCRCGDVICRSEHDKDSNENSCLCACAPCRCDKRHPCRGGELGLTGSNNKEGKWRGPPGTRSLEKAVNGKGQSEMLDLIRRCLDLDPWMRMTAMEALKHSWFRSMSEEEKNGDVILDVAFSI